LLLRSPSSTLFPYTTLFRSLAASHHLHMDDFIAQSAGVEELEREVVAELLFQLVAECLGHDEVGRGAGIFAGNTQLQRLRMRRRSEEHTSELQSRENLVCRL